MRDRKNGLHWIPCPVCGGRTQARVYPDTVLINSPLYCRKCQKETRINVVQLKMVASSDQNV
ncbi:cysteine-rich KTR domain-containing protein [uncultured Oscillibacter sp.]|uniref:cysteine-rich KTR domain-containing protein n=1 Tax=uncultured Oscillibacter sp. TaxID=876091 RepID=UPI00272D8842|nr:cysteine-rich KTR domain-containing protein [uncultured Oscillibacter sp.]